MTKKQHKIEVQEDNCLCFYGKDIMRARYINALSRRKVCDRMNELGYGYYPVKLLRFERRFKIRLPSPEVMALIHSLNCDYNLVR